MAVLFEVGLLILKPESYNQYLTDLLVSSFLYLLGLATPPLRITITNLFEVKTPRCVQLT